MNTAHLLTLAGGMTAETAAKWVRACLAEAEALKTLDKSLFPPEPEPAADERARLLRVDWGRWAEEAAGVYRRVCDVPGLDADDLLRLRGEIGRGSYLARRSLENSREAVRRAEAGDCLTAEEARRELALLRHR